MDVNLPPGTVPVKDGATVLDDYLSDGRAALRHQPLEAMADVGLV